MNHCRANDAYHISSNIHLTFFWTRCNYNITLFLILDYLIISKNKKKIFSYIHIFVKQNMNSLKKNTPISVKI